MQKEQEEAFCLDNYLLNVFNCRSKLRCGEKVKPVFFKLASSTPKASSSTSSAELRRSENLPATFKRLNSDKSSKQAKRSSKDILAQTRSWKTSTRLPGLPELVFAVADF